MLITLLCGQINLLHCMSYMGRCRYSLQELKKQKGQLEEQKGQLEKDLISQKTDVILLHEHYKNQYTKNSIRNQRTQIIGGLCTGALCFNFENPPVNPYFLSCLGCCCFIGSYHCYTKLCPDPNVMRAENDLETLRNKMKENQRNLEITNRRISIDEKFLKSQRHVEEMLKKIT